MVKDLGLTCDISVAFVLSCGKIRFVTGWARVLQTDEGTDHS